MFCKYCGKDIAENAEFCPECGKKLKAAPEQEQEARQPVSIPLVLMLVMLCGDSLYVWGRFLLFGERVGIDTLISTVVLVAGLAVVGVHVFKGKLDPSVYRVSDVVVLACACIVVPWLVQLAGVKFLVPYWGENSVLTWAYASRVTSALQLTTLWLAVGITLLGRARTAPDAPRKKAGWLVYAAPLLCVLLGISFTRPIVHSMDAPLEVLALTVQCVWTGSLFIWLWPLVILKVLRALGEDRVGPVGAVAAFFGTLVGAILMLPMFIYWLALGMTGYTLANGLAPLFSLLALRVATRHHKRKNKEITV